MKCLSVIYEWCPIWCRNSWIMWSLLYGERVCDNWKVNVFDKLFLLKGRVVLVWLTEFNERSCSEGCYQCCTFFSRGDSAEWSEFYGNIIFNLWGFYKSGCVGRVYAIALFWHCVLRWEWRYEDDGWYCVLYDFYWECLLVHLTWISIWN
jgi:hypothetical protein